MTEAASEARGIGDYDRQTALLVVDVQNDLTDPAGGVAWGGGGAVLAPVNSGVAAAQNAGATVVYTQDWHPESTPHFAKDGGVWPVHCVGGTWGAELHPDLEMPSDAPHIRKGTGGEDGYSGFTMRDPGSGEERSTGLDALLKERGVERVVIMG